MIQAEWKNGSVTATCRECKRTVSVKMTQDAYRAWRGGILIQRALPEVSKDDRELLISGICGQCFTRMFQEQD
jgi:hypothetical protein